MAILADCLRSLDYRILLLCNPRAISVYPPARASFDKIIECESEAGFHQALELDAQGHQLAAVFFDDYGLNARDHSRYRRFAPLLAGIDDLASRPLDWDLLFDLNLGRTRSSYAGLISDGTQGYFGADYQIIKPEFFRLQAESFARKRWPLERVFISLGGTDPFGLTGPILASAAEVLPDAQIDIVAGSMSSGFDALEAQVRALGPRATLHADAQHVARLMCDADLAIGAGGTMTWERNVLGLPTLILLIADNQLQVGEAMRSANAAIVFDVRETYDEQKVKEALALLQGNAELLQQLSQNARSLGGANGAEKIAKCIDRKLRDQTAQEA